MADLRIVDAPLLSTVKGTEKIPTGGEGNFSISVNQVADFAKLKWFLATEGYVDNAVGNVQADLNLHKNNFSNPHQVTKAQVGLGNVDNTADIDKPVGSATQAALTTLSQNKAEKTYVDAQLNNKADKATTYTKTETESLVSAKSDTTYVNTKYSSHIKTFLNTGTALSNTVNGEYFFVISNDSEKVEDLYLNVNGVATNQNKSEISSLLQHNSILGRDVTGAHQAASISTASGVNQQQINDFGGVKWYAKVGGYELGATVKLENGDIVKSTAVGNTVNPITDMTGWEYDLEWMTGWITPQMFGAKADGVTFDELAIRKCLAYARSKKKAIWMGGANCIYRVKHYAPEEGTINYLFHITENTFIKGAGAKINVDHTTIPTTTASQYFMFAIERPTPQLVNYAYIVNNIYISGVKMDGGYVYENDTDKHNLNDKFKLRAITNFETRVNNFVVTDCEFSRFGQNNTITSFFSSSFNNYGIGKGIYIDKCKFINNGYEGDHSTLYFMDDSVEITRCTFHIDKAYNLFGSHAVEFHGKDSYADNIHVYNYIGGVIFGTNTQSGVGSIGNSTVTNSVFRVYADACSLWSGEVEGENSTGNISVLNNKADILADDGLILSSGNTFPNKAFFGIPIANKPIEGFITIKGNSGKVYANVPTHIVDLAVGAGIDVPVVDIEGNNFDGATSMLHVISRNVPSSYYQSIRVVNNGMYHYANKGAFAMVLIESKNDPAHVIRSLLVSDNSIVTYVPANATLIDIKSGYVDRIYQSNNSMPIDSRVLNLAGGNVPQIYSNQPHNVNDYLSLPNTSLKSSSSQTDILRLNIPASQIVIAENGTEASISLGFINNNTRITRVVGKLSDGISTSGIPINMNFKAGSFFLAAGISVADTNFPVFGGDVSATNQLYPYSAKLLTVDISSYDASKLVQLKNSGLSVLVEVTVQKVYY